MIRGLQSRWTKKPFHATRVTSSLPCMPMNRDASTKALPLIPIENGTELSHSQRKHSRITSQGDTNVAFALGWIAPVEIGAGQHVDVMLEQGPVHIARI